MAEAAEDTAQDVLDPAAIVADDAQTQDTTDQAAATETKARAMGWDPDKGPLSAADFVKRGDEIAGFVKKHNGKLERELADMKKTLAEAKDYFSKSEERAFKRAVAELEARQDAAVAEGDTAEVRKITKEITELTAEIATAPKSQATTDTGAYDGFVTANPWFKVDEDLTAYAMGLSFPAGTPDTEQFRIIGEKVRRAFPAKFTTENPRRQAAPAVEGAQNGRRVSGKTFADLPKDAQAMCDRFVKSGFIKDRAAYVASYDFGN